MTEFAGWPASSKIILERVTVNVVISEVDAVTYYVYRTKQGSKARALWGISC